MKSRWSFGIYVEIEHMEDIYRTGETEFYFPEQISNGQQNSRQQEILSRRLRLKDNIKECCSVNKTGCWNTQESPNCGELFTFTEEIKLVNGSSWFINYLLHKSS